MKERKTKYPGVRVRNDRIVLDFKHNRIRHRMTLKIRPTAENLKYAYSLLGEIEKRIFHGTFDLAEYFPNSKVVRKFSEHAKKFNLFEESSDRYLRLIEINRAVKTYKNYKRDLDNHILPTLGHELLSEITLLQIEDMLLELDLSKKSLNNVLIPLRGVFDYAVTHSVICSSPMNGFKSFSTEKKLPNPLEPDEIDSFLDSIDGILGGAGRNFFGTSIFTPLSTGEQIPLQWKDIDFDRLVIYINKGFQESDRENGQIGSTKNAHRARSVEMIEPAYQALKRQYKLTYKNPESLVFVNPRTQKMWQYEPLTKIWRDGLEAAGITYRRAYQTRHTYASIMLSAGLPLSWIKQEMGHSSYKMLEERYARWLSTNTNVVEWLHNKTLNGHNGTRFTQFFLRK